MSKPLVECVPNLSEGRRPEVIAALEAAVESVTEAVLLDRHTDADHNRTVLTFAGPPGAVVEAALRLCGEAVRQIDVNRHQGVHPRIGALDVLPFVPVRDYTMAECAALAYEAGREIWHRFEVPVYYYESAARDPERRLLANIRRAVRELAPDAGGPGLHPTAGAVAVGARKFLIAWNVHLDAADVAVAREISAAIRESSGGLPCVRALGLYLAERNAAQVSMNLTDYERTGLAEVFTAIKREADRRRVRIRGSELVGLIPRAALEAARSIDLRWENLQEDSVFEERLERRTTMKGSARQH